MYNTGNSSKNVTTTSIVDGTISNADVDASAAIAQSKLATLAITDSEVANDALSGDKIDGGTISDFASTGIDDNANANAITIDVNERVVIGGSDSSVTPNASADDLMVESSGATGITIAAGTASTARLAFADSGDSLIGRIVYDNADNSMSFGTAGAASNLSITSDGRGLSQFTAKAWGNYKGTDTNEIRDSHNISSVTDVGTGDYQFMFSNDMANDDYAVTCAGHDVGRIVGLRDVTFTNVEYVRLAATIADGTITDADGVYFTVFGD